MRTSTPAPPFALTLALALAFLGLEGSALGQAKGTGKKRSSKPAAAAAAPTGMDAKAAKGVVEKLVSRDATQVVDGLTAAGAAGAAGAPVAPAIETILSRGSTLPIAKAAIEALGAIGVSSSSAVLRPYLRHRVPELRRAAARALGSTRGPEALAAFKEGLRSIDGQVRGFSATGLGTLGTAEALPELFLALDRGVSEAAASIGQLCSGAECNKFIARLGKEPFDVMTSGIDPILFRSPPFSDEVLIRLIGDIRELGTPEAGRYLADVLSRFPASGSKRVRQSLDSAISSLPGGGK
jgi:HEAT repeat protein